MSALFKHRNKIVRFLQDLQKRDNSLRSKFSDFSAPEQTLWVKVQKAIWPNLEDSSKLLESGSHIFNWPREDVESILMTSGHYDPTDLSPYLERDNQDQLIMLKIILKLYHPNGRSHCSDSNVTEPEATTELQNMSLDSKVIETEATTKLSNMSLDSKVIETEAPKDDMITVDLETQDAQLDPKQNQVPKKGIEAEGPKDDMVTVDLNTLDPKPNPIPKKTMTPRQNLRESRRVVKFRKLNPLGSTK